MKDVLYIPLIILFLSSITSHIGAQTGPASATPSQDRNYIIIHTPQVGVQSSFQFSSMTVDELAATIQYFDGLGRLHQVINVQASPTQNDIIQPIAYDVFGREVIKYLPYTDPDNSGNFRADALNQSGNYTSSQQYQFYQTTCEIAHDLKPYAETIFEASPLNRVLKQGAVGEVWQPDADPLNMDDHSVKLTYETNAEHEVLLFQYNISTEAINLSNNVEERFYQPNQLFANKTYDEHNNEVIAYSDKEGRTVCKKVQYATEGTGPNVVKLYAATYYLYDDFGNLVAVLPPESVKHLTPAN